MFKKAVLNLTLWYLALVMSLSLSFSIVLYNSSVRELTSFKGQQDITLRRGVPQDLPTVLQELMDERDQQITESKNNIAWRLIYFNIIILVVGGALSYLLARRTLQPIEESVEAQNRFTGDASHELRTPLTAMRSELEVALRDKDLNLEQSKELHHSVLEEIGKLELLTNGLLKLAKQDAGQNYTFEECSIGLVAEEAVERVRKLAEQKQIDIQLDVDDRLKQDEKTNPYKFNGDHWALVELLSILLDNSIKYSSDGSKIWLLADINISKEVGIYPRGMIVLRVKDQGNGIKASDLPYIFNRFYRADHSRSKNKVTGYGLGLAIAKQIAEAHHGHIEVVSTPGKGSEFIVKLRG